jgi:hypothetical protein
MDSAKLNDWMQVVGIFAVVASLIFVGLEMRQSQRIALADYYQAQSSAKMDHFDAMLQAQITPVSGAEQFTTDDSRARFWSTHWDWTSLENIHYQYQAGFLTDEAWGASERRLQRIFARCNLRMVYDSRMNSFRPSFVAIIESFEDPCK